MGKNYNKPRWNNDEAIALTWKIIHLQDVLLTSLSIGIKEIQNEEYDTFKNIFLVVISRTVSQLNLAANDILDIRRGPGRIPRWMVLAYDTDALTTKTQQALEVIKNRDIRRNDWGVTQARLVACKKQFRDLQAQILRALPPELHPNEDYVSNQAVLDVYEVVRTLEMGTTTTTPNQGSWRRR